VTGASTVGCDAGKGGQVYVGALSSAATPGTTSLSIQVTSPSGSTTYLTIPVTVN
jgi:hypothetical protein